MFCRFKLDALFSFCVSRRSYVIQPFRRFLDSIGVRLAKECYGFMILADSDFL
jgi:hypothetical protein